MNNQRIRLATPEDAEQIYAIYEPYILNTAITFEYEPIPLGEYKQRMEKIQIRFPWLVYEEDNKILGYAYAAPYRERAAYAWDCESSVYIAKEAQGKGIATRLYNKLFKQVNNLGYVNIYAYITYPNDKSVALHKKLGFREVGIFKKAGYKLGQWWDLMVMEKAIGEHKDNPEVPRGMAREIGI